MNFESDLIYTGSALACVLYLQLLLKMEFEEDNSPHSRLKTALLQCRKALRQLFGEISDDASVSSSRPHSRAAPRRRVRDTRSPRTRVGDECLDATLEAVLHDLLIEEVAEASHQSLRTRLSEWFCKMQDSKEAVKELQELISHEECAAARLGEEPEQDDEKDVDESSSAAPDTYYTIRLCEEGDMDAVVGSVRLEAATRWAGFCQAVKEQLGYDIQRIRYDDDFGPKQAKDIVCSTKSEWRELRDMMEEDKEEIQDVLTVEVFKAVERKTAGGYLVRSEQDPHGEGAIVDLKDLREMLSTCTGELQTAQKAVLEFKRRLKTSWKYCSHIEGASIQQLQAVVRASHVRRNFSRSRGFALFAAHIFKPSILRHFTSIRWRNRRAISATKLQCALRGRQARKLAYLATVEAAATTTITEVAMGMIFSISEEARAIHKEWIVVDATNAARDFQRVVRLRLSPSREAIIEQFAKEDLASIIVIRFFRAIQKRKRFFRSAIAAVTTENILFGPPMDRAFKELLKEGKAQHMQAIFRRIAVQSALLGHVTSASAQLAETWVFQDLVMEFFEYQDQMYDEPRRIHAATWLQTFVRRLTAREQLGTVWSCGLMFQTTIRRRWGQIEWRKQYDAMRMLHACFIRQRHRRTFNKLWLYACKVQTRARSMRLLYATRRFKRMVDHLVDVARTNLYRRFYIHTLLVGNDVTSHLGELAEDADYRRDREAAEQRDAHRKQEADRRAAEDAGSPHRRRRAQEGASAATDDIKRVSSVEKMEIVRKRGQEIRESKLPEEKIFKHSLHQVIVTTWDIISALVSQQHAVPRPQSACASAARVALDEDNPTFTHVDGSEAADESGIMTTDKTALDDNKGTSEWLRDPDVCSQKLREFVGQQLHAYPGSTNDDPGKMRQHILFWLRHSADDLARHLTSCSDVAFLMLHIVDFLLHVWSHRTWIKNPGSLSKEVDMMKAVFGAFYMMIVDSCIRLRKLQGDFPKISLCAAILQCLQESCSEGINQSGHHQRAPKMVRGKKFVDEIDPEEEQEQLWIQYKLLQRWLDENRDAIFVRAQEYANDSEGAFWAQVCKDFLSYCYTSGHVEATLPLSWDDFTCYLERYDQEFNSDYGAIETPYQTYDNVWTLIFAGQDDYMDTTKEFKWTPEGYSLNASSGELVPVDVPDTKSIKSLFSTIQSLSFDFEKEISSKIVRDFSHIHPVGFLGALSARRRRERVRMWTALAIETSVCKFLNNAIRVTEGAALITMLRVFTILCLRPGRGTLLYQIGCVQMLNKRIVGCETGDSVELSSTAAFALQSLLSDAYVASQVDIKTAVAIADQLNHPVHGTMHVSVIYCLQLIIRNNHPCKMELASQTWLHRILLTFLRMEDGPEGAPRAPAALCPIYRSDVPCDLCM